MVADYTLLELLVEALRRMGLKPYVGVVITTSATFIESLEWAKEWSSRDVICVECEVSVLYTLARLARIQAVAALVVSDSVVHNEEGFKSEVVAGRYAQAVKAALEAVLEHSRLSK